MSNLKITPSFWCRGEVAQLWLVAAGWKIKGKRADKSGTWSGRSIPAPVAGRLYDLHDVAWEERVSCDEIIRRIHKWAAGGLE